MFWALGPAPYDGGVEDPLEKHLTEEIPLGILQRRWGSKTIMTPLPDGGRSLRICAFIYTYIYYKIVQVVQNNE